MPSPSSFVLKRTSKDYGTFWNSKWNRKRWDVPPLLSQVGLADDIWFHTYDNTIQLQNQLSETYYEMHDIERYNGCHKTILSLVLIVLYVPLTLAICVAIDLNHQQWRYFYIVGVVTGIFVVMYNILVGKCLSKPNEELLRKWNQQTQAWNRFVQEEYIFYQTYGIHVQNIEGTESCIIRGQCGGLSFRLIERSQSQQAIEALAESLHEIQALASREDDDYDEPYTQVA